MVINFLKIESQADQPNNEKICVECGSEIIYSEPNYVCSVCGIVYNTEVIFGESKNDDPLTIVNLSPKIQSNIKKYSNTPYFKKIKKIEFYINAFKTVSSKTKCLHYIKHRVNHIINFFHLSSKYAEEILGYLSLVESDTIKQYGFKPLDVITAITYHKIRNFVQPKEFMNCLENLHSKLTYNLLSKILTTVVTSKICKDERKGKIIVDKNVQKMLEKQYRDKLVLLIDDNIKKIDQIDLLEIQKKYQELSGTKINNKKLFFDTVVLNCKEFINKIPFQKINNNNPRVVSSYILSRTLGGCITKVEAVKIMGVSRVSLNYYIKKIK